MPQKKNVHDHFRIVVENFKNNYICKYCDSKYTNKNATKFARHLVSCKKAPVRIKKDFEKKSTTESRPGSSASATPQQLSESSISSVDHVNIHSLLARAIYVTGQPLSMLEHPLWMDVLKALRSDYEAPSRKMLSTTLLNEEYSKVQQNIHNKIQEAKVLHLAVDGWSNLRNESILNVIIYTPRPYFFKFIDTKNNRHSSEYLAEEISKIIEELGARKFVAIVTDNAANMIKCARIITNEYSHIMSFGCIAHTLHLVIGDVLKISHIQNVFVFVVAIVKCVTNSHILNADFTMLAKDKSTIISLILPVKTRWGSYLDCLQNFVKSKVILQSMAVTSENTEFLKYKAKILQENTWIEINKHIELLQPIVKWIVQLEGDYGTIHLVHQALKEIKSVLNSLTAEEICKEDVEDLRAKYSQRETHSLKAVHYAAAILDPNNQGVSLTTEENLDGCQFILDRSQCDGDRGIDVFHELAQYKNRTNNYSKDFIWSSSSAAKVSPVSWWTLFFPQTDLGKTALGILSIPSTSASVERSFSTFSNIHSCKRNKLTTERAGKLCLIAHNWKLMNPKIQTVIEKTSETVPNQESDEDFDFIDIPEETLEGDSFQDLSEDPLSFD